MPGSSLYRGDLLRILAAGGEALPFEKIAGRLCGFDYVRASALEGKMTQQPPPEDVRVSEEIEERDREKKPKLRFWRAEFLEVESEDASAERHRVPEEIANAPLLSSADLTFSEQVLTGKPLLPWSRVWPFLREVLGQRRQSRQPDLPRVVRLLAGARPLLRLPRKLRRAWHPQVHVLLDRRDSLASYWDDYDDLLRRLKRMRGTAGLHVSQLTLQHFRPHEPGATGFAREDYPPKHGLFGEETPLRLPFSDSAVLALGDLNQYQPVVFQAPWLSLGRKLRNCGIVPVALCPCPRSRWSPAIAKTWKLACWDRCQHLSARGEGQRAQPISERERVSRIRQQLDALFPLLAPAVRVERGLLRDLRFLLPSDQADVSAEYDAFQARETSGLIDKFTLHADKLKELRERLALLDARLLERAILTIRDHHNYCSEVFGHMEILGLYGALPPERYNALVHEDILRSDARDQAVRFYQRLVHTIWTAPPEFDYVGTAAFGGRDWHRLIGLALKAPEVQAIWALANQSEDRVLPETVKPERIAWLQTSSGAEVAHEIVLADGLVAGRSSARDFPLGVLISSRGSFFSTIQRESGGIATTDSTRELAWNGPCRFEPETLRDAQRLVLSSGRETLHLLNFERPPWAGRVWYDRRGLAAEFYWGGTSRVQRWIAPGMDSNGQPLPQRTSGRGCWRAEICPAWAQRLWADEFGVAVEFSIGGVPFILRWIPPGRFLMGSPEDEAGHGGLREGPQHEETISRGFWLGETSVTQAQWRAVVEAVNKNDVALNPAPSYFRGPGALPTEQVSWHESAAFCRLLDGLLQNGPGFSPPTEAQWEYACRAGSESALYTGGITILGEHNAPELDAIAWYGGNSGLELEVENPCDSKEWRDKAYLHKRAGTHRVRLKQPNAWGLFDMSGNVWEWCSDAWSNYEPNQQADPFQNGDDSAPRVVRGGSWHARARLCRAASRIHSDPGDRWDALGLRLSAGHESTSAAEPRDAERHGGG